MPIQVIPVNQLDTMGFNADTPPPALPPQAFDDVNNVRFRDGAIQKMEGEVNIFPQAVGEYIDTEIDGEITSLFKWNVLDTDSVLKYVAWWPNPNLVAQYQGYYLLIVQKYDSESDRQKDHAYIVQPDGEPVLKGIFEADDVGAWQHTFFQGGFCLIINNGQDVPHYILDPEGNTDINEVPDFAQLPGWESYNVNETLLSDTFNESQHSRLFDLGQLVDYEIFNIAVSVAGADEIIIDTDGTADDIVTATDTETNTTTLQFNETSLVDGNVVTITLRSKNPVQVRCGVIRSFGDFLVAANLSERDDTDFDVIVRNLPGIVRTSDVAAPGAIPNNWNPFAAGVSTADEFVVTQEGIVQEMLELQGSLYIYSNSSISILRQTGNPAIPLQVTSVTDSYGVQTTNGAIQFDGQHFVVGSQDIYIFGGHPGNIQSCADGRVRNYFYNRLNPLHEQRMFLIRHRQKDEIWICFPSTESITGECDEALIWNYRKNVWTRRDLYNTISGDLGPVPGGGVPSQLIHLQGQSGDNGITNIGSVEVQSLTMDPDFTFTGDTEGRQAEFDLTVEHTFTPYDATGTAVFDIILEPGFNTGSDNPLFFIAQGRDTDGLFTFDFEIQFSPNLTTKQQIIDELHADSEFNTHFDLEDVADSDGEFILDVKTAGTVETVIEFGVKQQYTRDDLVRDSDRDIINQHVYDTDTFNEFNRLITSVYVGPEDVGHYYYLDLPGGTFPENTRMELVPNVGINQDMYDQNTAAELAGDNSLWHMYGDSDNSPDGLPRGGLPARPVKDFIANHPDSDSQYMYRIRQNFVEDTEVSFPWIPTTTGMHEIAILVPSTFDWNKDWVLTAYDAPPLVNSDGSGIVRFEDPYRRNPDADITAPPVLVLRGGFIEYDPVMDMHYEDRANQTTTAIALGGNYSTLTVEETSHLLAEHIANHINDETIDAFHFDYATDTDNVVHIRSGRIGKHFLAVDSVIPGVSDLEEADFTIERTQYGRWSLKTNANPNVEGERQIYYPEGYHEILDVPFADTDLTPLKSFNWTIEHEADGVGNLTATNVIKNVIIDAFSAEGIEPGWTSVTEEMPNDYMQVSSNYGIVTAKDRPDGNVAERIVPGGSFNTTVTYSGNVWRDTDDVTHTRAAELMNFVWSRADSEAGNTGANGVTWEPANDFRGAFVKRATPSYMAVLIYNSEVTNGFELYITEAGLPGDYVNDSTSDMWQMGENGVNYSNEETAEKWIEDIRLANRRLNVLDRGTDGQFLMQPSNYDETANFVLETAINDTQEGADRIWHMYLASQGADFQYPNQPDGEIFTGGIHFNPRSDIPYRNELSVGNFEPFQKASRALPVVIDTEDSQINPSDTRVPNRVTDSDDSDILRNIIPVDPLDAVFDVDRPWPRAEVNFNKYYPIFAQNTILDETKNVNKVVGGDIGWSIPLFSTTPRSQQIFGTDLMIDEFTNDAPQAYRSVVYRSYLPVSPEFEVENIHGIALWADGSYIPGFFEDRRYPRLLVDTYGLDVPGAGFELDTTRLQRNIFYISEDYKVDLRTNGRFLNIFIGDQTQAVDFRHAESETIDGKDFDQKTPWRVSGVQLEVMKGGHR